MARAARHCPVSQVFAVRAAGNGSMPCANCAAIADASKQPVPRTFAPSMRGALSHCAPFASAKTSSTVGVCSRCPPLSNTICAPLCARNWRAANSIAHRGHVGDGAFRTEFALRAGWASVAWQSGKICSRSNGQMCGRIAPPQTRASAPKPDRRRRANAGARAETRRRWRWSPRRAAGRFLSRRKAMSSAQGFAVADRNKSGAVGCDCSARQRVFCGTSAVCAHTRVGAKRGDGARVGEQSGAAAGVETGDAQHERRVCHAERAREFPESKDIRSRKGKRFADDSRRASVVSFPGDARHQRQKNKIPSRYPSNSLYIMSQSFSLSAPLDRPRPANGAAF